MVHLARSVKRLLLEVQDNIFERQKGHSHAPTAKLCQSNAPLFSLVFWISVSVSVHGVSLSRQLGVNTSGDRYLSSGPWVTAA